MFVIPVAVILFCRYAVPAIRANVPVLPSYYWLIVSALTSITTATPAFLIGFILLDERDENIHIIQKILPLPQNLILKCRIIFMVFMGFIFSLFIFLFNGLITFGIFHLIALSLLFSLIPPVLALSMVSFAKNKIEATTIYKGLSIFLVLPVAAFFIRSQWNYLFGIIPFFWTYNAVRLVPVLHSFIFSFTASLFIHLVLLWLLYRHYKKLVF